MGVQTALLALLGLQQVVASTVTKQNQKLSHSLLTTTSSNIDDNAIEK